MSGEKLSDEAELLFRNISESWIRNGRPTSQAYRPTPKDKGRWSADRSAKTTAENSFKLHTVGKGLASVAVYAPSVGECIVAGVYCYDDPIPADGDHVENQAHVFGDFNVFSSNGEIEKASKKIKKKANERGPLYEP